MIANGLNFMNALFYTKSSSVEGRNLSFERSVETREERSIALLWFTTINGLLSFVAAMFTTMLPLSAGWRYFWLFICLATFGLSLIGLFCFARVTRESSQAMCTEPSIVAHPTIAGKLTVLFANRPLCAGRRFDSLLSRLMRGQGFAQTGMPQRASASDA
jgi:hypothetical protein